MVRKAEQRATGATPKNGVQLPSTRRLHISLTAGPRLSVGDLTFNPNFSDWIMGWPIGWTDPTRPVTGMPAGCGVCVANSLRAAQVADRAVNDK